MGVDELRSLERQAIDQAHVAGVAKLLDVLESMIVRAKSPDEIKTAIEHTKAGLACRRNARATMLQLIEQQ